MYEIILASESPRRKEILETMGVEFITRPANIVEEVEETLPDKMVEALARMKVTHIAKELIKEGKTNPFIIIGADTMVYAEGEILGKPKNVEDAKRMIRLLSGGSHEVFTGVSIYIYGDSNHETMNGDITNKNISFSVATKVYVNELTEEEIDDYVATKEPMDKAGAYAIQGKFGIFIKGIEGDYYNIVGFPIARIYEELKKNGINIKK